MFIVTNMMHLKKNYVKKYELFAFTLEITPRPWALNNLI